MKMLRSVDVRMPPMTTVASGRCTSAPARVDNATDRLYRNHLNYLKDVLPEMGRSVKLVYSVGF